MKIAITWSNWFVWSYAVKYFWNNNEIIAFQRQKNKKIWNIEYIKWDLKEKYKWFFDCDIFIHCASDTWYEKSKKEMIKNNVEINKNILEVINKSNCKHFIYISSSSVYQWITWIIDKNTPINESNLINSYSYSKYKAEVFIKDNIKKDIKLTILRPRAIYGEWDKVLEPNILKYQIFWKLILLWNWKNKTSLTEINYFIKEIDLIIKNQVNMFEIINISNEIKDMENIYKELATKHKLKWIIKIPIYILKCLYFLNPNKISYLIDSFENDKIFK